MIDKDVIVTREKLQEAYARSKDISSQHIIDMPDSWLWGDVYMEANLQGANFRSANLTNINFTDANLRDADFTNAEMRCIKFKDADLAGAKLDGANMVGVYLTDTPHNRDVISKSNAKNTHMIYWATEDIRTSENY